MNKHHNKQVPVSRPIEWLAHKHGKVHTRVIVDHQRWAQRQHRGSFSKVRHLGNLRESVLVYENVVVGWATGAENSPVT